MNLIKSMLTRAGVVATGVAVSVSSAQAALPAGVADAIATAEADGVTLGGLFLGMAVTVGVLFWLKRKAG